MPKRYLPYQTCHRRFQSWSKTGVMSAILAHLAQDLHAQGDIDLSECFIDGTLQQLKKGLEVGIPRGHDETKRGKGTKIMVITDGSGIPIAIDARSQACCEHS